MHSTRRPTRGRGFTLVGMLVTLGVIAITMAVGGPALWEMSLEFKLRNTAREAVTAMRAARYRAITEVREFGVIAVPGSGDLEDPGEIRIFSGDDATDVTAVFQTIMPPGGVWVSGSAFGPDPFVVFRADGSANNSGAITLSNANQHTFTVSLDPASTARMRIIESP